MADDNSIDTDNEVGQTQPQPPGARLRAQRERRGLTLAQVGSELHVNEPLLRALEGDDYSSLGAPIFVKGHLRNYARLLGLDAAEVVAAYEAAQQPADPALVAYRPDGPRMDHHGSHAWVGWFGWVFLLLLGVLLAGWWYYQREGGAGFELVTPDTVVLPQQIEEPADDTAPQDSVPQGATGRTPQDALAIPETTAPVLRETDSGPATTDTNVVPETSADVTGDEDTTDSPPANDNAMPERRTPPVTTPAVPATRPETVVGEPGLVLTFNEESWVEVYDAEGRPILYDLVGAGARRTINAGGELRVFLGNSDGVEVFVGGERFAHERYRRRDSTARFTVTVPAADE